MSQNKQDIIEADFTGTAEVYLQDLLEKIRSKQVSVESLKSAEVVGDTSAEMVVIKLKK
ncbi:hypothetical protein [Enterobacter kobei]|uniref:hypothetical protein n=1 Tax=Enterobacter kobei TaxID=208224 RepID=UPI002004751F|nr:hypothetical protein [Enterobacter kobei]ELR9130760.1 hypothetical protein [Enterobacter cloacae]MCK7350384.1 hypothetical protein [Enterobacter kobei]